MFGRVRRAVAGEGADSYAVLHVYSPEAVAGALAIGMGAAGVGSGAAIARTADGRQVSALAEAVNGAMGWGRRQQRRFLRLPRRVLVVVTGESIVLYEWTFAKGKGPEVATWPANSYSAEKIKDTGEVGGTHHRRRRQDCHPDGPTRPATPCHPDHRRRHRSSCQLVGAVGPNEDCYPRRIRGSTDSMLSNTTLHH